MPTRVKIAGAVKYDNLTWVTCDLLEGETFVGMLMKVNGRNDVWKVVGVALSSAPDLHWADRRSAMFVPQRKGQRELEEGDCLEALQIRNSLIHAARRR